MDTAFYGPVMRIADSVHVKTDSLSRPDSLKPSDTPVLTGKTGSDRTGKPLPKSLRQNDLILNELDTGAVKTEKMHRARRPVREIAK